LALALVIGLIAIFASSGIPQIGAAFFAKTDVLSSENAFTSSPLLCYQTDKGLSKGKFLVAKREMRDPRFSETVILLIEYGGHGSMGLVINRPTVVRLATVLPEIKGLKQRDDTVYLGGPVNENQMLLLIRSGFQPRDSLHVFEDIYVSSSLSELQRLTEGAETREAFHAYAGYAGWALGQLDLEVSRGDWHVLKADSKSVFEKKPSDIWPELIQRASAQWVKHR
jgi:putative transcriptional regulator